MPADALVAFEPRKTPIQARSTVTVESICEATIQVLLSHGAERLTTTRVAERAGVSVGTLYQYYPNKQSLLFAVLEHHMNNVAAKVEAACESACHKPLAEMIKEMVEAFVDAKMERADISVALYRVSGDVGGPALIKRISQRSRKAVGAMYQRWRARCVPCWRRGRHPPRSENRENNSCFFVSHTWRPRQLSGV
jgi:AcrR family transcriptional regulator